MRVWESAKYPWGFPSFGPSIYYTCRQHEPIFTHHFEALCCPLIWKVEKCGTSLHLMAYYLCYFECVSR